MSAQNTSGAHAPRSPRCGAHDPTGTAGGRPALSGFLSRSGNTTSASLISPPPAGGRGKITLPRAEGIHQTTVKRVFFVRERGPPDPSTLSQHPPLPSLPPLATMWRSRPHRHGGVAPVVSRLTL